jgi:hypothetical protein
MQEIIALITHCPDNDKILALLEMEWRKRHKKWKKLAKIQAFQDYLYYQEMGKIDRCQDLFMNGVDLIIQEMRVNEEEGTKITELFKLYETPQGASPPTPPVIQLVMNEGLVDHTPDKDGKHKIIGDKKDRDIIKYIFDNSGYSDSLTAKLYMDFIETHSKQGTIERYIQDARNEANG